MKRKTSLFNREDHNGESQVQEDDQFRYHFISNWFLKRTFDYEDYKGIVDECELDDQGTRLPWRTRAA